MPRIAPVRWQMLEKVFVAAGFPAYREVPVSIIKNNMKTAAMSREEYFRLLETAR